LPKTVTRYSPCTVFYVKICDKGEIDIKLKKFIGYSPPFNAFLIESLNTGRVMRIEKYNMEGADKKRAGSG